MLFDWRIVIAFNPFSRAKISWHQKQSPNVVCRNGILRNSAKFTGKHLCQSFFFNKAAHLHMWKSFFFQKKLATTLHKFGYVEILLYDFSKGTALKLNQVSNSSHFTEVHWHIHEYIVLQCSDLFHSKVLTWFLWQDLQSSYSFSKIQNLGDPEKNLVFHWRKISYFNFT